MSAHRDLVPVPPEAPNEFLGRLDPEFGSRMEPYPIGSSSLDTRGPTSQKSNRTTQLKLSFDACLLKDLLASRILKIDPDSKQGEKLSLCHTQQQFLNCKNCNTTKVFWNRCERRFCPLCAKRLARERNQQFQFWFRRISRPKFLTLTLKNCEDLSEMVQRCKKAWSSLRRSKLFEPVRSGLWSMEVTHQGKGWHVHLHAVIESPFIAQEAIERAWSKRIGQSKSIVDIRELTGPNASQEALKYTCKPSQMVNWSDSKLIEFLNVTKELRMFGVWGELHAQRGEWKEFIEEIRVEWAKCECGCNTWRILDPPDPGLHTPDQHPKRPPPPPQLSLGINQTIPHWATGA